MLHRNYIYEDAFDKLSPDNEANLRLKMRVQLVNAAGRERIYVFPEAVRSPWDPSGLDEAGIDGGGLFREFLSQLLKAAFDPNRGFFTLTRDQMLYPRYHESGSEIRNVNFKLLLVNPFFKL